MSMQNSTIGEVLIDTWRAECSQALRDISDTVRDALGATTVKLRELLSSPQAVLIEASVDTAGSALKLSDELLEQMLVVLDESPAKLVASELYWNLVEQHQNALDGRDEPIDLAEALEFVDALDAVVSDDEFWEYDATDSVVAGLMHDRVPSEYVAANEFQVGSHPISHEETHYSDCFGRPVHIGSPPPYPEELEIFKLRSLMASFAFRNPLTGETKFFLDGEQVSERDYTDAMDERGEATTRAFNQFLENTAQKWRLHLPDFDHLRGAIRDAGRRFLEERVLMPTIADDGEQDPLDEVLDEIDLSEKLPESVEPYFVPLHTKSREYEQLQDLLSEMHDDLLGFREQHKGDNESQIWVPAATWLTQVQASPLSDYMPEIEQHFVEAIDGGNISLGALASFLDDLEHELIQVPRPPDD